MRHLVLSFVLMLAIASTVAAEEYLRSGTAKDCYLYSWGKGPDWTTKVTTEFRLGLLGSQMPYIDDQYSEPTEKALRWIERRTEPVVTNIATVEGRKVVQIVYPEKGQFGKTIGTILLAIETARQSEWFSPFFGAQPELFNGAFVNGKDIVFGYVATLEWSGTGALRTHRLFDLRQPHPVIVATLEVGSSKRKQSATDAEHEQALQVFDREAELLEGITPKLQPGKK